MFQEFPKCFELWLARWSTRWVRKNKATWKQHELLMPSSTGTRWSQSKVCTSHTNCNFCKRKETSSGILRMPEATGLMWRSPTLSVFCLSLFVQRQRLAFRVVCYIQAVSLFNGVPFPTVISQHSPNRWTSNKTSDSSKLQGEIKNMGKMTRGCTLRTKGNKNLTTN